jgi:hypothetical protein
MLAVAVAVAAHLLVLVLEVLAEVEQVVVSHHHQQLAQQTQVVVAAVRETIKELVLVVRAVQELSLLATQALKKLLVEQ